MWDFRFPLPSASKPKAVRDVLLVVKAAKIGVGIPDPAYGLKKMTNSLQDIANIFLPRNTFLVREERVKREGSKYYPWEVPVTATTASQEIHIPDQFPDSRKYSPLDWLEVINNEAVNDLTLTINGNTTFLVPAGTMRTISRKALWNVRITNNGGVNTTLGAIVVTVRKQPMTIDKWASRQNG